jgi:uncharacterized protein
MTGMVRDNSAIHHFELDVDGHTAFVDYRKTPEAITLVHTEVPKELGGRGVGSTLVRGVLEAVRAQGLKLIVKCPFVKAYMEKHPEFNDLLK